MRTSIGKITIILFFIVQILIKTDYLFAAKYSPFEIMPWRVGQYVIYQIISMENEGADNRYKFSLIGKERIGNETYFWLETDIYESIVNQAYNKTNKELRKNISFKALVAEGTTTSFIDNPSRFILTGLFPGQAKRLLLQIGNGQWHEINPQVFFSFQRIIEDTPYSLTPYAKGEINFTKLKINEEPEVAVVPVGTFDCYHFFVKTLPNEEYWYEGIDLWRSPNVPILGLVKMEFSKTLYWEKWEYRNRIESINTPLKYIKSLFKKRVSGRRRPDTHTIMLLEYGQK